MFFGFQLPLSNRTPLYAPQACDYRTYGAAAMHNAGAGGFRNASVDAHWAGATRTACGALLARWPAPLHKNAAVVTIMTRLAEMNVCSAQ